MDKETFEIMVMDYLAGEMTVSDKDMFDTLLKENPEYQKTYLDLEASWHSIQKLNSPEPSKKMDDSFFNMLSKEVEKNQANTSKNIVDEWFGWFRPQFALGALLLLIGLGLGYFLSPKEEASTENNVVDIETEEVRQKLVLTLLEQPSANQRLQGVGEANKIAKVDEIVIKALLKTLNSDTNVNVRLAAVESLTNYVDNPLVRQGLVQAIPNQESPIMQITLANLMVALQEKASIEPFKQLLKEQELDTTVKKKIKNSIESII
ncbi:HEAT repeat domain-containing protein [Flagellimonas meridianipacifica]|uniref:HEAT repeat protein n=1 Tax=Flagellimonas meridianipacifica TaxID=1080225 RepID=A0A2T0MJA5_9FLAO|nr:HEAT repeat domain-containing protein [Allomuricauda pacifica]PRX57662.1 HEAT repeat protein [Allomuricauda pacifica]